MTIPAMAAYQGPGGEVPITEIVAVQDGADEALCILEGTLVKKVTGSKDKYVLKDATGEVIVEIDDELIGNQKVSAKDKVKIHGRVDKDHALSDAYVEAYTFEVID